ncbi:MAG TPA: DUF6607 family protein [Gammaproteobacteria bacterium]|jgi:hypothetical protein
MPVGRHFAVSMALALAVAPPLEADEAADGAARKQFTFSWQFSDEDAMRPRGGTTRGPAVELAAAPSAEWRALQEPGLSDFERDRRAILAMAGPYRTSFDFLETVQFTPDAEPVRPYQSWGTEYVYVAADEGDFISLQHVIVMFFEDDEGTVSGPIVTKHWRQDWRFEDRDLHVYVGRNTWERRRLSAGEATNAWTQAVFQVDDTPRYEASGRWVHDGNYSAWTGNSTWRPLPRREVSVRDDYDVLAAVNRHTILPRGWVHEENNLKLVLDERGELAAQNAYLARELGVNRYERIEGFDFSAGDEYWMRTAPFWAEVRAAWNRIYEQHERFGLAADYEGEALFQRLFDYADGIEEGSYDSAAGTAFIDATLDRYLILSPR